MLRETFWLPPGRACGGAMSKRVLSWADVPEHVRATIRALKPTEQRPRAGIVGDPSNMVPHGPIVDAECAASFREWLAEAPSRARAAEEKAAAERARMGKP